jgi:phosphoenolpyruvate-protein kinase (PTS system EI component)
MVMVAKMDEKGAPEHIHSRSGDEIELRGITICPGIGIGRVRVLDRRRVFPRTKIPADQVQTEKQRYDQALQLVSDHLLEHIKEDHADSSLSASMILKSHQAMLTDEQFHDAVRSRIVDEFKSATWALELEAMKIITQLEASRSPYLASRAEDVRDLQHRRHTKRLCRRRRNFKSSSLETFTRHGPLRLDVLDPPHLLPRAMPFHHMQQSFSRASGFPRWAG